MKPLTTSQQASVSPLDIPIITSSPASKDPWWTALLFAGGYLFLCLLIDLMFLPISTLTNNNPAALALMDASGIVLLPLTLWMYGRYSKVALLWLLPLFIWGPFTLFIKVWLWLLNNHSGLPF